ncbi:uncharacterized protein LOC109720266 [Ananas comosus]|uniref:Uncharacterized protein LOC109720266 n=1 Tax=Ananas comosus TaxID=4615 RepID=A0A6P5G3C6_ANACO|nr:uncharacterized protein LOC109720266 [Ananas comosus]
MVFLTNERKTMNLFRSWSWLFGALLETENKVARRISMIFGQGCFQSDALSGTAFVSIAATSQKEAESNHGGEQVTFHHHCLAHKRGLGEAWQRCRSGGRVRESGEEGEQRGREKIGLF